VDLLHLKRALHIETNLLALEKVWFKDFLTDNWNVFAQTSTDMPGVNMSIIYHWLLINPEIKPVKQKPRKMNVERCQALSEEVDRLLQAHFIRETHYPDWLSDLVLVKKKSGKWIICIGFTNLNQTYPMDNFPLSKIDQLVDTIVRHEIFSFMGASFENNQIKMHPLDAVKTSFITD